MEQEEFGGVGKQEQDDGAGGSVRGVEIGEGATALDDLRAGELFGMALRVDDAQEDGFGVCPKPLLEILAKLCCTHSVGDSLSVVYRTGNEVPSGGL
jgi:hypothetical protein